MLVGQLKKVISKSLNSIERLDDALWDACHAVGIHTPTMHSMDAYEWNVGEGLRAHFHVNFEMGVGWISVEAILPDEEEGVLIFEESIILGDYGWRFTSEHK